MSSHRTGFDLRCGTLIAYPTTAMPQYCRDNTLEDMSVNRLQPVLFRSDDQLMMCAVPEDTKLDQLLANSKQANEIWYDEHGLFRPNMMLRPYLMLTKDPPRETIPTEVLSLLPSLAEAQLSAFVPTETDILVVVVSAPAWPVREVIDLWNQVHTPAWLAQHGRKMNIQILADHCRLLFVPIWGKCATPVPIFRHHLQVHMARVLLKALDKAEGVHTTFKYDCRHLVEVMLPKDLSVETIYGLLKHAFMLTEHGQDMSLVSFGKRLGGNVNPEELLRGKSTNKLTIQVRHSLWGGGPSPGSKMEHHHLLHTELASKLHDQGFSVPQTPMLVDRILREYGTAKVRHVLFQHPEKQKAFQSLCDELGIVPPERKHTPAATKQKFQKLAMQAPIPVEAADFALQTGFFCYEDGKSAEILQQLNAWTRGVMLMDQRQAAPWLNQSTPQSPDELAIFIPTSKELQAMRETQFLQAPAKDREGNPVLLGGCLLQLGEKKIQTTANANETAICPTRVCSVTMWKEEYHPDQWALLLQAPVKFAKQTLGPELQQAMMNPWARSFKKGKDTVPPPEALSVQFHCEIHVQHLHDVLRLSGYNKLHMVPKTADARPSPDFAVIWMEGTTQEIQAKAAMIPGHAGFVKSKKKHGARFEVNAFPVAWAKLKPGEEMPDMQIYEFTYRLQPLPYGVDANVLKQWATNEGWQIKPLKNQGPGRWLVASHSAPPAGWMTFNGQAILIHQLPQKTSRSVQAVVTGEPRRERIFRSQQNTPMVPEPAEKNVFRMGDPHLDPWKSSAVPKNSVPDSVNSDKASSSASTVGPTAQAIQRQDQRIASVEQKLQEAQQMQQKHQNHVDGRLKDMEHTIQTSQQAQKVEMDSMRADFRSTLREATDKQQESLQAALLEFKMLFLSHGTKRNRSQSDEASQDAIPPRPRLEPTDSEMED